MSNPIVRRSDFVRPLDADTRVDAQSAHVDRVEVSIGDWALIGDESEICACLSEFRHIERETTQGQILPVFKSKIVKRIGEIKDVRFTSNPNTDSLTKASTLVSGACTLVPWRYQKAGRLPDERARLRFRTQLNLTRFLQAQNLRRITRLDRPSIAGSHVLEIVPDPTWYLDEIPLMPATNVIIGPDRKYAYALKSDRSIQFRRYVGLIDKMLNNVVERSFYHSAACPVYLPHYTLHAIEFYWEFDRIDAINYMVGLRPAVMAGGLPVREKTVPINLPEYEVRGQSPRYAIWLTKSSKLVAYAKTNRRVRFEVRFWGNVINKVAGPRTSPTLDDIVTLLPDLAERAARYVNVFLQSIASVPIPPTYHTAVQLMHIITREAEHPAIAETILSGLIAYGRVSLFPNDPLRHTVHRLKEKGVLETNPPRSATYVVTAAYRGPLARLQQLR